MRIEVEQWELQMGPATGAVVIHTKKDLRGEGVELWLGGKVQDRVTAQVVDREGAFAAIFPAVPPGNHEAFHWRKGQIKKSARVTVWAGHLAEVDWR